MGHGAFPGFNCHLAAMAACLLSVSGLATTAEELAAVRGDGWRSAEVRGFDASTRTRGGAASLLPTGKGVPCFRFKVKEFLPARLDSITVKYRASGGEGGDGGWLYHRFKDYAFSIRGRVPVPATRFRTPPLVADGEWHSFTIARDEIAASPGWLTSGIAGRFCYEPGVSSGRVDVAEVVFLGKASEKKSKVADLPPDLRARLDEDVWPEVAPETWSKDPLGPEKRCDGPVQVRCRGMTVEPARAVAGSKVTLRADYEGDMPSVPFKAKVKLIFGGDTVWEEDVWLREGSLLRYSDRVWRLQTDYTLPVCFDSRRLVVRLEAERIVVESGRFPDATLDYVRLRRIPGWEKPSRTGVAMVGGSPRFTVDGKPVFALWGTALAAGGRADGTSRHSSAPLNFVTVWASSSSWRPHGEEFRTAQFDRCAEMHVRAYPPEARFIWDLSVYPPSDWAEDNPDEMARDGEGRINCDAGDSMVNYSFASEKAMDLLERMVEKAIRYLEQSPYADRIAGYRINSGFGVEWSGWIPAHVDTTLDFSAPAQRRFEEYARANWPEISDFSVPTIEERRALDGGELLWDVRRHARAVAYNDFYSDLVADDAIRLCRRARELVGGNKLIGTYYGYVMALASRPFRAHYAMKRFLDSKAVDFVMCPPKYGRERQLGASNVDYKPFGSIAANGIVNVIENDMRTHNVTGPQRVIQMLTEEQSVAALRRDMGIALCRNEPFYSFAICGGSDFDFPAFAADATCARRISEHALARKVRRRAEIAYIISEESIKSAPTLEKAPQDRYDEGWQKYRPDGTVERQRECVGMPLVSEPQGYVFTRLARIGAPVDYLLAEDVVDHPGDYKLYIFACCSRQSPALVKAMEKLRRRNCTILWTGAPGYVSREGSSLAAMKALTGADFGKVDGPIDPGVRLKDGTMAGITHNPIAPVFYLEYPDEVIGVYSNGKPGLAAVKTGAARTVFSGSHRLELPFLRRLAAEAGVFIFSESTDPFEANDCLVSLHARFAGRKTIRLPRKTDVYDVFADRLVARGVDSFSFNAPLHTSYLFYYGDDAASLPPVR